MIGAEEIFLFGLFTEFFPLQAISFDNVCMCVRMRVHGI